MPFVQTSEASVPKPVRVRVPAAHTLVGMAVIDEVMPVSIVPIEVEARLVFVLTVEATDVEALPTMVLVLVFTLEAIELDAVVRSLSVAREPEVKPAPVRVRVAALHTSVATVPKLVSVRAL